MTRLPVPLDVSVLKSYSDGDVALENELLEQFLESTRADVDALHAALGSGDLDELGRAAHRVKGSSRMIGAEPQGLAAEHVEHAARGGDAAGAKAAVPALEAEHARLVEWLRERLGPAA